MKLTPILLFINLLIFTCSCSPQKRFQRLIKNHPELISKIKDTIIIPSRKVDTSFKYNPHLKDTIVIQKNNLLMKYFHHKDTVYLSSKYLGDTIYRDKYVYYPEVKIDNISIPLKWKILFSILLLFGVLLFFKLLRIFPKS